jgi:lipoprotein-releasing system ATP-binding protein
MMDISASPLYALENIWKVFPGPGEDIAVLRGVRLQVEQGERLAVVGASGTGKSTLLHILGALDAPSSGEILFDGLDLTRLGADEKAGARNRKMGFIFQFHHLLPEFTAEENVAMQAIISGMAKAKALGLARQMLERVGLAHRSGHSVTTLSGGERQRVAIARATLLGPRVLLADEPTGNLDEKNGELVRELLLELNRDLGTALIVATHDLKLAETMGRCLELRSGELYEAIHDRSRWSDSVVHDVAATGPGGGA